MDDFTGTPRKPTIPKVVVDRYRKHIREEDANRAEANYTKAAGVGALAGLAARLKNTHPKHRAMIGAGAGLLAEGIVRSIGKSTKDAYGERSRVSKKSEKIPVYGGAALASGLIYHRLRRAAREFGENVERRTPNVQRPIQSLVTRHSSLVTSFAIPDSLRRKLIAASALAGGITAADVATTTAFPNKSDPDEQTKKAAAMKGLRQGALYGTVLAGSEPVLRHIAQRFAARRSKIGDRRSVIEFRVLNPSTNTHKIETQDDVVRQRRRLALYAGGALAGVGALALLAKRPGGGAVRSTVASAIRPSGRGTLERLAKANALRQERGYVHLRPMAPGQRKRFDKLPTQVQQKAGHYATLAEHPQLSPGEHKKFRQAFGRIRGEHKFSRGQRTEVRGQLMLPIYFSAFVKDIAFKDLPAMARKDIRAFHPTIADDTLVSHYGVATKELAAKADPNNLAAARKNVGKISKKACSDEVYAKRGKKFILLNNDRLVDGHHFLAKAERGRVTASLHAIDLTPSRFQKTEKLKRGKAESPSRTGGKKTEMERKLHRAVEFMYAAGDAHPVGYPGRGRLHQRRKDIRKALTIGAASGTGLGLALGLVRSPSRAKLAASSAMHGLRTGIRLAKGGVHGLSGQRVITFFKRREQLREGGKSEAEKGSGRFVDPLKVTAGLSPGYASLPGGERRYYGGHHGEDLAITHAQVLRSAYQHGGAVRKTAARVGGLFRDVGDVAVGNPRRTDSYGRPQRREWEKPWFHKAAKDAVIGAGILGGALALKRSPALRAHVLSGAGEIKRKINKHIPDFFAGAGPNLNARIISLAKRFRPVAEFDEVANYAGWDVRDPRGRSARVFAPGSRKRVRREKEWHERIDNQRKLLSALALVGTVAGAGVGVAVGRKYPHTKIRGIIQGGVSQFLRSAA
jgi:hypothetical protein